jgi:hypothetical protein
MSHVNSPVFPVTVEVTYEIQHRASLRTLRQHVRTPLPDFGGGPRSAAFETNLSRHDPPHCAIDSR